MARDEIPPGTLDMLILKTLVDHPVIHGFEIAQSIRSTTFGVLEVEEGSLYPALQRMLIKGWITGRWSRTDENRRARFYRLTPSGRKQLAHEIKAYRRVTDAITSLLAYA